MSNNLENSKADFIRLVMSTIEDDSSDKEKAKEYLSSQGLNVDSIVSEGLKKIKRMKMEIQAQKTKEEMLSSEKIKQKADQWVENLLNSTGFSLVDLVKEEELAMSFRNIEKLSKEDLKKLLVKHFTLKFLNDKEKGTNGF
jgi:hypothetical protein